VRLRAASLNTEGEDHGLFLKRPVSDRRLYPPPVSQAAGVARWVGGFLGYRALL